MRTVRLPPLCKYSVFVVCGASQLTASVCDLRLCGRELFSTWLPEQWHVGAIELTMCWGKRNYYTFWDSFWLLSITEPIVYKLAGRLSATNATDKDIVFGCLSDDCELWSSEVQDFIKKLVLFMSQINTWLKSPNTCHMLKASSLVCKLNTKTECHSECYISVKINPKTKF